MDIAIITTCTNRKKKEHHPQICSTTLPKGDQNYLLRNWIDRLKIKSDTVPAKQLYSGRGFAEIRQIAEKKGIDFWVISAGMGLVNKDTKLPSYNLTISCNTNESIQSNLSRGNNFDLSAWWQNINHLTNGKKFPIADLISKKGDTVFVISTTKKYLELISSDIFNLDNEKLSRVRFVGLKSIDLLPLHYQHLFMPYDDRLDGPSSPIPGTRVDFPQRSARHFIEEILSKNPGGSPQEHANIVLEIMNQMSPPIHIVRPQKSDNQIKEIIIKRWGDANGSCARMLRILRDQEFVACEQSRFSKIFRQIKSSMP